MSIFSKNLSFYEDKMQRGFKDLSDIKNFPSFSINEISLDKIYSFSNLSLLIVDDDPFILNTISPLLRLRGFSVFTSKSLSEGSEIYQSQQNKIKLIILNIELEAFDYNLSVNNLFSLNKNIKVIGLSKNLLEDELPRYFKNNLYGFLSKPFLITDLLKVINKRN